MDDRCIRSETCGGPRHRLHLRLVATHYTAQRLLGARLARMSAASESAMPCSSPTGEAEIEGGHPHEGLKKRMWNGPIDTTVVIK